MKKLIFSLFFTASLLMVSACAKNNEVKMVTDSVSEPIIVITDTSKDPKSENNDFWLDSESKNIYFKKIFWSSDFNNGPFYNKQVETNNADIKKLLEDKKTDIVPLPKHNKIEMVKELKHPTPNYILGKIRDEKGEEVTWKQTYKDPGPDADFQIKLPSFKGKSAVVSLRFIWLNENHDCYGVADKIFNIKKI
ncbi:MULTISPECIES: hypothetical protein [Bacillus subtilis group]|uniref:hypothetical protein n=1 Tax=Bacillus subtilis group TaxID=653685 RepID=UPI002280DF38|nr:hypothetical protein [Bacillus subtilis]MCY8208548.1 hypothetical protein [Bacillus subtilis]MED3628545.1 hypothetical protein [Bacillus subtilis]